MGLRAKAPVLFLCLLTLVASFGGPVGCAGPSSPQSLSGSVTAIPGTAATATMTASAVPTRAGSRPTSIPTAVVEPSPPLAPTPVSGLVPSPTGTARSLPTATATPTAVPKTPTPVPPTPTSTPQARAERLFLGYYVPYDSTSWLSLEAQASLIDYVAPQWLSVDLCGNIGSQDNLTLVRFARSHGIGILPTLLTSSGGVNHRLLTDSATSERAISQLVDYVVTQGYDGLDIDLEGVDSADRKALTAFVAELAKRLHDRGKLVTMAVPAKTYDATTGWAGAYDYAALAPHVDKLTIMAYAYTTASSAPGSTAPYSWVDKVAAFASSQIPASKVLLGLAFYGYDWNVTMGGRARALRYPQAEAVAQAYGATINLDPATRSAVFSYTARAGDSLVLGPAIPQLNHEIVERSRPPCALHTPGATPVTPPTPSPTATPAPLQQHTVWLENGASVGAKLDIARRYGLGGVGAWRLGQEDAAVWPLLSDYRRGQ